jgi:hypothetical protein
VTRGIVVQKSIVESTLEPSGPNSHKKEEKPSLFILK